MMAKVVNSAAGMASHIPSVPSSLGRSSFLNSADTLSRSKSIASLFIIANHSIFAHPSMPNSARQRSEQIYK
mgnify:CR=1 FL=1